MQREPKKKPYLKTLFHGRLKVWQRLFLVVLTIAALTLVGTAVIDFSRMTEKSADTGDGSGWEEPVYAYVVTDEGVGHAQLYTEGLGNLCECGRGISLEMESWEPFIADDGSEYYHIWYEGRYGYIAVDNISENANRVLQESQVYVRTATNLYDSADSLSLGAFVDKGMALNVMDYDYLNEDGSAHMYQVKCGEAVGWISSAYVTLDFAEALEYWNNEDNIYETHVYRGDTYGTGNASELDYYPREKGDFADNVMPEACYCLYIPCSSDCLNDIDSYLALADATEINTFVFTVCDNYSIAYPIQTIVNLGLEDSFYIKQSREEFAAVIAKVQAAGYYTVARMSAFQDAALAEAFPALAYADTDGSLLYCNGTPWLSAFSRDAWELKLEIAVELAEEFGFNEIMFDNVMIPYGLTDYASSGADLRNENNESCAQALQRFLMYAADVLHENEVYLSVMVMGESSNNYVTLYGQYWDAFSTVADVMCATPFPDNYSNYWTSAGYYIASQHPYSIMSDWGERVSIRQSECSTPAKVRTWIQCWDSYSYDYDNAAIQREILGLYDNDVIDGYGAWSDTGNLDNYTKMQECYATDYYALYQEAEAAGQTLSEYMGVSTSDNLEEESTEE